MKLKKYNEIRHLLKTGDLILWSSNSLLGWIIRKFSGEWNHASEVFILNEDTPHKRIYIVEALEGGVDLKFLSTRLSKFKGEVAWFAVDNVLDKYRIKAGTWVMDREAEDIGYDYWSLFKNAVKRVKCSAKKLFCSETWQMSWYHATELDELGGKAARPADMPERFGFMLKEGITIYNSEERE